MKFFILCGQIEFTIFRNGENVNENESVEFLFSELKQKTYMIDFLKMNA